MVRVYLPGFGLQLRVAVTTNGQSWTAGVVDTASQAVETAEAIIPASKIKRVCYMGTGTWLPPDEIRVAVLLLAAIGGMPNKELWALARLGAEPEAPSITKRPRGRPRKPLPVTDSRPVTGLYPVTDSPWEEIPVGLEPGAAVVKGRVWLEKDDLALAGE